MEKDPHAPPRVTTLELEYHCKDGSTVWVEVKTNFLFGPEGRPVGILGVTRDIAKRKRAEEAYRALVDHSLQGLAILQEGRVVFTNQAMAEIGLLGELRYGIHAVLAQAPDYDKAPPELVQAVEAQTLGVVWTQVQQMRQNPVIAVEDEAVAGAEERQPWNPITYYIPGFTVAFAFFLVGQMAMTLLREKEEGTFRRLLSSPLPRASIVGGKMLAYMGIIFLQVIVLFGVGVALFKMSLGESPLALLLLTLALALASASLGMLLGALCRTSKQADTLGNVLGFILMVLGGTIVYPLFRAEGFIGTLSRLTPNAWGVEGYMGLLADNWTLAQTAPNILILAGFAAVFFGIAVWRFKFE